MKHFLGLIIFVMALVAMPAVSHAADCEKRSGSGQRIAKGLLNMGADRLGIPRDYGVRNEFANVLSAKLACALTPGEQKEAAGATTKALKDSRVGVPQSWTSDENDGVTGSAVASAPTVTSDGRQCRSVTNVGYVDGKEIRDTAEHCKSPGSDQWVRQT